MMRRLVSLSLVSLLFLLTWNITAFAEGEEFSKPAVVMEYDFSTQEGTNDYSAPSDTNVPIYSVADGGAVFDVAGHYYSSGLDMELDDFDTKNIEIYAKASQDTVITMFFIYNPINYAALNIGSMSFYIPASDSYVKCEVGEFVPNGDPLPIKQISILCEGGDGLTIKSIKFQAPLPGSIAETDAHIAYDFDYNTPSDGWRVSGDVENVSLADGLLSADITGSAPMVETAYTTDFAAIDINNLELTMQNGTSSETAKLYFQTDTTDEWAEENCIEFPITPNDSDFTKYTIWTDHPNWTGTITGFRLVPADTAGRISIDQIRMTKFPVIITQEESNISVSGKLLSCAGETLNVQVTDDFDDAVVYEDDCTIDEQGAFSFSFTGADNGRVNTYGIRISGADYQAETKIQFTGPSYAALVIASINDACEAEDLEGLLEIIATNYQNLNLNLAYFDAFFTENQHLDYFAEIFVKGSAIKDSADLTVRLDEAAVLTMLQFTPDDQLTEAVLQYEPQLLLKELAQYQTYDEMIDTVKLHCISAVNAKKPESFAVFRETFAQQVIFSTIAQTSGWELVETVLETYQESIKDGDDVLDLSQLEDVKNPSDVYTMLCGEEFKSYAELIAAFDDAVDTVLAQENKNQGNSRPSGGGGGGGGSSRPSGSGGIIHGDVSITTPEPEEEEEKEMKPDGKFAFSDMTGYDWAVESVENLRIAGIVEGRTAQHFVPQGTVTREEFVKMAMMAINASGGGQTQLTDVQADAWYAPYINTAVAQGYINGISQTEFGVGQNISREDVCVLLYRILDAKGKVVTQRTADSDFTDRDDISDYALSSVDYLYANGMIQGMGDGTFSPKANLTRAEAAVLIDRTRTYLGYTQGL